MLWSGAWLCSHCLHTSYWQCWSYSGSGEWSLLSLLWSLLTWLVWPAAPWCLHVSPHHQTLLTVWGRTDVACTSAGLSLNSPLVRGYSSASTPLQLPGPQANIFFAEIDQTTTESTTTGATIRHVAFAVRFLQIVRHDRGWINQFGEIWRGESWHSFYPDHIHISLDSQQSSSSHW